MNVRNRIIDIYRGIAIGALMIAHVRALTDSFAAIHLTKVLMSKFAMGVPLFFVLSGYLISQAWERGLQKPDSALTYATNRFFKIYPLYILFYVLQIALFSIAYLTTKSPQPFHSATTWEDFNATTMLLHLFLLQGIFPVGLNAFVSGSWSIVCEVYFYVLFPILLYPLTRTLKSALATLAGGVILSFIWVQLFPWDKVGVPGWSYYNFGAQLPCFLIGCAVYRANQSAAVAALYKQHGRMITGGAVFIMAALVFAPSFVTYQQIYAALLALCLLASLSVPSLLERLPCSDLLARMGEQSYSLFLLHLPVLYVIRLLLSHYGVTDVVPAVAAMMGGIYLTLVLSNRVFHPIDSYFVGLGKMLIEKRRTIGKPVATSP